MKFISTSDHSPLPTLTLHLASSNQSGQIVSLPGSRSLLARRSCRTLQYWRNLLDWSTPLGHSQPNLVSNIKPHIRHQPGHNTPSQSHSHRPVDHQIPPISLWVHWRPESSIIWPVGNVDLNLAPGVLSLNQIPGQLSANTCSREMTGNYPPLRENEAGSWRQKTITTSLGYFLSPATSRQDCLKISQKVHIKTNDQGREGEAGGYKDPDTGEVFVCQTGQHHQLRHDTKYVTRQLQLVRALLQLWLFVSLSYLLYQRLHFTSALLWQELVPSPAIQRILFQELSSVERL